MLKTVSSGALRLSTLAAVGGITLLGISAPPALAQEKFTLRLTSPVPRGPAHVEAIQWWADEVEERSGGRIEFQIFYAGSLMGALETLPATRDGRVDGGYMSPGYWPRRSAIGNGRQHPVRDGGPLRRHADVL